MIDLLTHSHAVYTLKGEVPAGVDVQRHAESAVLA